MDQNISMTDVALLIGNLHIQVLALQSAVAQLQAQLDQQNLDKTVSADE